MIYKISFVVPGRRDAGGIENADRRPRPGDQWQVGDRLLRVVEVIELMPPRGEFTYLHATCTMVETARR